MSPLLRHRAFIVLCLAGIALVGVSGKLWLLLHNGFDLPYLDQWHAEAMWIFIPEAHGELHLANFFAPHNEHRVFWSRLLTYGLVNADGQWDCRVGLVLNAFIHAVAVTLLLALVARPSGAEDSAGRKSLLLASVAAIACLAIPFAWENTLATFQSQFYLWQLFTVLAVWLMLDGPALGRKWWAGFVFGTLALGTMGSGFLAFVAAAAVHAYAAAFESRRGSRELIAIGICAAMSVLGSTLVNHVPGHEPLHAHSLIEFVVSIANQLAFPATSHPWLAPLMQAPILIWWFNRGKFGSGERYRIPTLGIIVLAALTIAAIAWSRGGATQGRESRYGDVQAILFLINAALLARIVISGPVRLQVRSALSGAWCLAAIVGFSSQIGLGLLDYVPGVKVTRNLESARVAEFLRTQDPSVILDAPEPEITFPNRPEWVLFLSEPAIASIMPSSVRPPVSIEPDTGTDGFEEGVPSGLPEERRSFTSQGGGGGAEFRSEALPVSNTSMLQFRIAGDLGTEAFPFHLRSLKTGDISAPEFDEPAGQRWKTVNIARPPDPVVIEAGPSAPGAWGAFSEPVELGRLAWIASKITKTWWLFTLAGATCLAASAILLLFARRRPAVSG